jgi:nucleotide-binding universal stress UspA family protein
MSEKRRLLIALDGSEQSFEAVRYASQVLPPGKMKVVLFHVQSKIPESFWDIEKDPSFRHRLAPVAAWAMQQEKAMEEFMERSRQLFVDQGVPREAVDVKIKDREVGIARDIAREAQKDYDAVVLGRWGMSKIKDLVWGSIANKVVGHLVQSPLWVVGGSPQPGKYLVAMDGSDEAMRAVDYVGTMLAGSDCTVTLFHVLRGLEFLSLGFEGAFVPSPEVLGGEEIKAEFQRAEEAIKTVCNQAIDRLEQAGLKGDQINTKIVSGAASRAKAIVEEAKNEGYGTIVVGRRGLSRVEEFFMGRVSSKVIQLAKEMAVWVVG